jgi:hypothetical protein
VPDPQESANEQAHSGVGGLKLVKHKKIKYKSRTLHYILIPIGEQQWKWKYI